MDRRILPGFRIQSEILTDFRILQLQRIADSSSFGARISDSGEILTADLVKNYNGSADLYTPIHPPH